MVEVVKRQESEQMDEIQKAKERLRRIEEVYGRIEKFNRSEWLVEITKEDVAVIMEVLKIHADVIRGALKVHADVIRVLQLGKEKT